MGIQLSKWAGIVVIVVFTAILIILAAVPICTKPQDYHYHLALSTIRSLATACENYKMTTANGYPESIEALINDPHPFLYENICANGTPGYRYECSFQKEGYHFTALPITSNNKHDKTISIRTGGLIN